MHIKPYTTQQCTVAHYSTVQCMTAVSTCSVRPSPPVPQDRAITRPPQSIDSRDEGRRRRAPGPPGQVGEVMIRGRSSARTATDLMVHQLHTSWSTNY